MQRRTMGLTAGLMRQRSPPSPCSPGFQPGYAHQAGFAGRRQVDNFMLADQTGMGHELFYYKNPLRS